MPLSIPAQIAALEVQVAALSARVALLEAAASPAVLSARVAALEATVAQSLLTHIELHANDNVQIAGIKQNLDRIAEIIAVFPSNKMRD